MDGLAFSEGYEARRAGFERSELPEFDDDAAVQSWLDGWDCAHEDQRWTRY